MVQYDTDIMYKEYSQKDFIDKIENGFENKTQLKLQCTWYLQTCNDTRIF